MKITIELDDTTATVEDNTIFVADALTACIRALIGVGFHGDNIREAVIDMAEELDMDRQNDGAC